MQSMEACTSLKFESLSKEIFECYLFRLTPKIHFYEYVSFELLVFCSQFLQSQLSQPQPQKLCRVHQQPSSKLRAQQKLISGQWPSCPNYLDATNPSYSKANADMNTACCGSVTWCSGPARLPNCPGYCQSRRP
jgi:hypothetical protein